MKKRFIIILFSAIFCLSIFTEGKNEESSNTPDESAIRNIPVQSLYSELIEVKKIYFNKGFDTTSQGEILEVEFEIKNKIDDPQDLYLFIIASYEMDEKTFSSLNPPVPEKEKLRNFVTHPDDINNFEYTDKAGKVKLLKQPRNPKAGIDPNTGEPYRLTDKLFIRTKYFSRYRNNYFFFNMVMILAFNSNGEPVYRQQFRIKGIR